MNIHLLHSNDVHSQLENYMRLGDRLRTVRERLKAEGEPVLTFDIGDVLDRVRPETEATMGRVNAAMMAALGYDGWVFGNNEGLTIPRREWAELVSLAQATVFGTNLRTPEKQPFPFFSDWHIYECGNVTLGVFGLTPKYDAPYANLSVRVLEPFSEAERAVQALRARNVDVVVALSHLGLREDRRLAAEVQGIDVILGGHTHDRMKAAEYVGKTAIFQPGKHAGVFGHTRIEWDEATRRVVQIDSTPVPVDVDGCTDEAMSLAYQAYQHEIDRTLSTCVGHLEEPLAVHFTTESALPNLLVDALFQAYPCDIGLMMSGAPNASLLAGEVTYQDLLGACPTPTRPLLMTLPGRDIAAIVESSLRPELRTKRGFGYGFRGSAIGYMALANARACVQTSGGVARLKELTIGQEPVVMNKLYRVVTCEYLWLSPVYEHFHEGTAIDIQPALVREVLAAKLAQQPLIARAAVQRYHVVANSESDDGRGC